MIFLTKENLEVEKNHLNSLVDSQQKLKEILFDYMQKFVDSTNKINTSYAETVLKFLEQLKDSLKYCDNNIALLKGILKLINNELNKFDSNNGNNNDDKYLQEINKTYLNARTVIIENSIKIEEFLHSILKYSNLDFFKESNKIHPSTEVLNNSVDINNLPTQEQNENQSQDQTQNQNLVNKNISEWENDNNGDIKSDSISNLIENTLVISELKGKIILPYMISNLEETLKGNQDKYSSIEDIINKDYTLPFDMFKNTSIARFREAFKLIRNKEKKSIKTAFDLGMELIFNYNLHPAIITACKNIDELDIYLDYLENNETDKFDCFKISFEVAPILSKK